MEKSIRGVGALLIIVDLGAQHTAGERMILDAGNTGNLPIFNMSHPATGILTIQWATSDNLFCI